MTDMAISKYYKSKTNYVKRQKTNYSINTCRYVLISKHNINLHR